jgi:ATP phosphoribosyltransferase regulatory subunit
MLAEYVAVMPNERISRIPPGSQDLLAGDVRRRRQVQAAWFRLAEERGYEEVIPPTFEYEEVFTLGAGPDLTSSLVRFVDQDGRLVALRADFTSSVARMAATKLAAAPLPLRISYAGKVYRQTREGGGNRREVFQLGAELIGEASAEGDVEVLRLALDTLRALELNDFQINLGEMRFIQPLLRGLEPDAAATMKEAIDRKDRAALRTIARQQGLEPQLAETLHQLPELIGRSDVLDRASRWALCDDARAAIERLQRIDSLLDEAERARVVYDLGEIRGLGYYTGIRFEVFVAGSGHAVGSGGRYDDLLGLYGLDRPAVGFALETDALAELLSQRTE